MPLTYPAAFLFLAMASTGPFRSYDKPPFSTSDLIAKLQGQGLGMSDPGHAGGVLDRISYFRFRGYLHPYLDLSHAARLGQGRKAFRLGATFEQALEMYRFDEGLRRLIFGLLPEIEVALRSVLDATLCQVAGHGSWHLQPEWFKTNHHPKRLLHSLSASFCESGEAYAKHYQATYFNDHAGAYKHLPPFWVLCELTTLGQLKEIFESLWEGAPTFPSTKLPKSTVLDKMAQRRFGADHYRDLVRWVHVLRDIRNVCAHHGRLWNRNVIAPPGVAKKVSKPFPFLHTGSNIPKVNTVYAALIALRVMSKRLGIADGIRPGLLALLGSFPEANRPPQRHAMGMPIDWDQDTVWT